MEAETINDEALLGEVGNSTNAGCFAIASPKWRDPDGV